MAFVQKMRRTYFPLCGDREIAMGMDGAVIGAGSVVVKDVAPNIVVAGNPAKFIKKAL